MELILGIIVTLLLLIFGVLCLILNRMQLNGELEETHVDEMNRQLYNINESTSRLAECVQSNGHYGDGIRAQPATRY